MKESLACLDLDMYPARNMIQLLLYNVITQSSDSFMYLRIN